MENLDKIPTVGGRIKYIREAKGYMQIGVAMGAGISQKALSKIELDQTNPSIYRIYRIAESLGVDVYTLIPKERWNSAYSVSGIFGHVLIRVLKWTRKRNTNRR
ncbi:helix-turn-helix domain-containing protein [Parapedobacter soli]|uniref:helix-turn-helix domain-containing protein n=1 Tax=Parapedobacter soli TaxID=416955 RepID=UPI0021C70BEF|nr:helix-turn-helix transcriptional regulator [Parapedobacter soli]